MTDVASLIRELTARGVTITVDGLDLVLRPARAVPTGLLSEVRRRKSEILTYLIAQGYRRVFCGKGPDVDELDEIKHRLDSEGYVLCRSEVLDDDIAFHRDDVDSTTIPSGFVPYSSAELLKLFPPEQAIISIKALKTIHAAKKTLQMG